MKIYLFLANKIVHFTLPSSVSGSYSFDEEATEEDKLINIEARDDSWVLYSTEDVQIYQNNEPQKEIPLIANQFYVLKRNNIDYYIFVSKLYENNLKAYTYSQNINLIVGNDNTCNLIYSCPYLKKLAFKISYTSNYYLLEKESDAILYINHQRLNTNRYFLRYGDTIYLFGLRLIFLPNIIIINDPGNISFKSQEANLIPFEPPKDGPLKDFEVKDLDLYEVDKYFSKSPRIRRTIKTKEIKLSEPPQPEKSQELPLLLTIGPMFTMGITSVVMIISSINSISSKQATISATWPSLVTSGAMLISTLLWPLLTRTYNKNIREKKRKEIIEKYTKYLDEKTKELIEETNLQKEILIENLITLEECYKMIQTHNVSLWNKRIEQNDFLVARIGMGNELLDVKIEYPETGFTIEEDELRKKADEMVKRFKYINEVPIGYSFYKNKVTAIMGNRQKTDGFINNILLQFLAFYSYEDLKIVVFTNEKRKDFWDYIKYLNHNFTNERDFRFFASTQEATKNVAEYLNIEIQNRKAVADKENSNLKPHYFIIIDDYDRVKQYDFIKEITETDLDLKFNLVILESRMGKLPSKCNNFITLGESTSGVLKNAYEDQEQLTFRDEINYNVDMTQLARILSNIPIEFEEAVGQIPDVVTFLEMEKVGKVEQLNILNRWNTNDSTSSLKAEIGIDESGEVMYLDLHEKYHGPHGLIAGMTGSGKSEFIITYILSMCINYSPDDISFVLIDYKGGGLAFAFENKGAGLILPHLAGTITNLDKAEMDRTLVSIDSEAKRRQQKFNEARDLLGENTIDIYKYQKFYKEGKLKEPIPHLFIVCDEFAELKSQQPDFMDNLISIARIGRSLGIHLILATQKPSGVVNDQIWSNSKFHICLKVQDQHDSNEMLKRPDAASLKQTGRFYLQVGYDEFFALGQSGWCGAKYYPSDKIVKQVDKSVNFIDDNAFFIKSIQAANNVKGVAQGEQLSAVMKSIMEVAKKTNKYSQRLWLENVPENIYIDELYNKYKVETIPYQVTAILGEYDAPEKQTQGLVSYSLPNDGNTIIYSSDISESEMLLNAILYSTLTHYNSQEVNYYLIDFGSQSLRKYEKFPQVGGIVFPGEDEKYQNLFKMIREELENRKKLLADYSVEYQNYIKNSDTKIPLKVVIINNYDALNEADKSLYDILPEIIRNSDMLGVIFILTANGITSIPRKISQNIHNSYALSLKDPMDYMAIFNIHKKIIPREMKGRGVFALDSLYEFQTASIDSSQNTSDFIETTLQKIQTENQTVAKRIPQLPEQITLKDIASEIKDLTNIPIGINRQNLEINTYDLTTTVGTLLLANRLKYINSFASSFIDVLKKLENTNVIVMDPYNLLESKKGTLKNYFDNTFSYQDVILSLINYFKNDSETKNISNVILIYGITKVIDSLENSQILDEFFQLAKRNGRTSIILADDVNKMKRIAYENWYTQNVTNAEGIWVGNGLGDQSILKTNGYSQELSRNYPNNMGFHVMDGSYVMIKLLEFDKAKEEI